MKTLTDWLDHCERLHPKNIDLGLDRVRVVALRMGIRFDCPVFTVAGTNGKGSTCAMLESILGHAGYRTGVYTSPHLVHFEERLRLSGVPVDASVLADAFARVERSRCEGDEPVSLTYFEFSTLAILDIMARARLDVVVVGEGVAFGHDAEPGQVGKESRRVADALGAKMSVPVIPCQLVDPASGREVVAEVLVALLQSNDFALSGHGGTR